MNTIDEFAEWIKEGKWIDTGGNNWVPASEPDSVISNSIEDLYLVFLKMKKNDSDSENDNK